MFVMWALCGGSGWDGRIGGFSRLPLLGQWLGISLLVRVVCNYPCMTS